MMNNLFTPFSIKNVTLRNRIVMAPMCMYSAKEDGRATSWHSFHYRTRAQGGTALIIVEATAVESQGRISSRDLGIWDDSHISGLKDIALSIKKEGAVPAIQLAHAGRKCCAAGEDVIAPSALNFDPSDKQYKTPREMGIEDIDRVVLAFKNAARRALEAGFEVLEIHGAHGYLINEFLSPLCNQREDDFGGTPVQRGEFLKRVVDAVRTVWTDEKPLILRVSGMDYAEGGNRSEDVAQMVNLVKDRGIDIVHVSSGGVVPYASIPVGPGYQIPSARVLKDLTGLPVVGGGLITSHTQAEEILSSGDTDLIFLGRQLLRNPYFPLLSAKESGVSLPYWPVQYARA
ncbi:NADPH dehydrogenase NamA [Oceanispirochaeta crateris]|uniref:NADPH dehydrogenase NamA n=2 Tax=Oceanispirochaeta crateris TaxID=2518645 RepID=A0A5C1QR13_9SPIO|nr:NADPH dehydrogenase NamA [Oceanispirochaeta crateris]